MIKAAIEYQQKYKLKKAGIKIKHITSIDVGVELWIEEQASVHRTQLISTGIYRADIRMGAHSYMLSGEIYGGVHMGRFCSIGRRVTLGQHPRNHPVDWASSSVRLCQTYKPAAPATLIGNDVWIGDGAVVFAGLTIGDGAIIGMNALVTKDVEPYQIVGGNPAKPIKYRFPESVRLALINSRWWDKDLAVLTTLNYQEPTDFAIAADGTAQTATYRAFSIKKQRAALLSD